MANSSLCRGNKVDRWRLSWVTFLLCLFIIRLLSNRQTLCISPAYQYPATEADLCLSLCRIVRLEYADVFWNPLKKGFNSLRGSWASSKQKSCCENTTTNPTIKLLLGRDDCRSQTAMQTRAAKRGMPAPFWSNIQRFSTMKPTRRLRVTNSNNC